MISDVAVEARAAPIGWRGASWAVSEKSSKGNNSVSGVCDLIYEHVCTTTWKIFLLRKPLGVTSFSQCSLTLSVELRASSSQSDGAIELRKKTPNTLKALERAQKCASRSRAYAGPLGAKTGDEPSDEAFM
jgi:hypothetical protein